MSNIKESYTSADSLPLKIFHDKELISSIVDNGKIIPRHIQFIPTNGCNLSCDFCSCQKEDRKLEMPLKEAYRIIKLFAENGCKSCTLTGGGETCLHPQINLIIEKFIDVGIKVGLVTNGIVLHKKINPSTLNKITWCRISHADFRGFDAKYKNNLSNIIKKCPDVDWAFSYVVSKNPNFNIIRKTIEFANSHNFTHVRLVADLFETENIDLEFVKDYLSKVGVNDKIVIYQGRKEPEHGGDCYIGYLKPVISADSKVYGCCGVQYSIKDQQRKMPDDLCFGTVDNFIEKLKTQIPMNGHICNKCYYMNYNRILGSMTKNIEHKEFI